MHDDKKMNAEDFVVTVFETAIREHASDIHFETMTSTMRIRFRIDGILEDKWTLPSYKLESVINTVKVLASLDITNHEVPQDGHFEFFQVPMVDKEDQNSLEKEVVAQSTLGEKFKSVFRKSGLINNQLKTVSVKDDAPPDAYKNRQVLDVRVSVYPSINGEVLVARILNRSDAIFSLTNLGMAPDTLASVRNLISKDSGMVLITGPAGSGKTTTLYSLIQELKSPERNIMTIEDPVEFHLDWLRQSELKPERGFTFVKAMRSILRQDPDVIMIGEIRDQEAAEHAVSVSLIGRIVGSTVHSNSTVGTVARFIDMNIERSMIAYAINGIISLRLVRKICENCRIQYEPDAQQMSHFGLKTGENIFYKGKGCEKCRGTGYIGRTGVFEVLEFDSEFRSLIVAKAAMSDLELYTRKIRMKTLKMDAVSKVLAGVTTIEEISRIV